jgi:hypothetical protein
MSRLEAEVSLFLRCVRQLMALRGSGALAASRQLSDENRALRMLRIANEKDGYRE